VASMVCLRVNVNERLVAEPITGARAVGHGTFARLLARLWAVALTVACSTTPTLRSGMKPADRQQLTADSAPPTSSPSPTLEFDPRVRTGKLANGLAYFVEPHLAANKRVQLLLVVKAGLLNEQDEQNGVAHFVEHMAFRGTKRFPQQSLIDFLEQSGLTFGADANAFTLPDRTIYLLSVPTDDPKLVDIALDVLADWAVAVTFDSAEVERERRVVLAEWLSRRGVVQRASDQILPLLVAGSRFAARSSLRDKSGVERAGRDQLLDFYRRWYRPQRMAVVAVGDIDASAFAVAMEKHFGSLAASPDAGPTPIFDIPVRHEATAAVITDAEAPVSMAGVWFKLPSQAVRTEGDYRAQVLSSLACVALTHRLGALAANSNAPWDSASASLLSGLLGRLDVVQITASPRPGKAGDSIEALLVEIERAKRYGFSAREVERAEQERTRMLDHRASAEGTEAGVSLAVALAEGFASGNAVMGAEGEKALAAKLLRDISAADVSRAATRLFVTGSELVLALGAARDALPSKDAVLADIGRVEHQSVERYQDHPEPPRNLMSSTPTPGEIIRESDIPEIGVTVWTLANGAKVVLKHTDFKKDEILEQSVGFGGTNRLPTRAFRSGLASTEIVVASGVGGHDRRALSRLLSGKVVTAYPWVSEQDHGIRASGSPIDVETMFQLIYSYSTAPRRDEVAFEGYRASSRERLRHQDLIPGIRLLDALLGGLWGAEPRRLRPRSTSVDEQNLDDGLMFYRQIFGDVSGTVFVFVGDFDEGVLRPLVERYLASLPGGGAGDTFHDLGLHRKKGVLSVGAEAGTDDRAMVNLTYHGEVKWSENAYTDLNSLRDYLAIRLREVLRVQMGGVYTPTVTYDFERIPFDSYSLSIGFPCQPSQVEDLVRVTHEVIERTKAEGVEAAYVEKLKKMRTRDLEQEYRTNVFWLERLVEKFKMKEDPRNILILHQLTQRVTSDNIKEAARHFLRDDQYVDARLLPAPGSSPSTANPP